MTEAITSTRPTLRVATHLAPGVLPVYAIAARRIAERLGRAAELVVPDGYARCGADLDDVCFVCSVPYVLVARVGAIGMEPVAAPVLRGSRYGGRPVYFSDVVVAADAPYRSFLDLAGSRWAYNEPFSHSGFVVALHRLAELGVGPGFIGEAIEAGFHDDSVRAVADGRADWAAIDSQVLDIWCATDPALVGRIRVLESLGPSTIQPVVVSTTRLPPDEGSAVADVLLALDRDPIARPLLDAAGVARFVAIDDHAYRDIRRMLDRVEAAGLLPEWWWSRWLSEAGMAAVQPPAPTRSD